MGFLRIITLGLFGKKGRSKFDKMAEKEFNNGMIVLPTDKRDYVDLEEFKAKTAHIPFIKDKLDRLEL